MANAIASNHAESVQGIKRLLHEDVGLGYRAMYEHEAESRGTRFTSPTVREGFKDFLARKPRS
jgi:enoyl-CoA hydratase/carnithine racemase